jgi:LPS O-antigen subunit length determinant protein (WzzB/FepE family)
MSVIEKKYDDEINLFNLIKVLWDGKWIIISLTIISFTIGWYSNSNKPDSYKFVTALSKSKDSTFLKYTSLNQILNNNRLSLSGSSSGIGIDSEIIFNKFVNEFSDYDEMVNALLNNNFGDQSSDKNYLFSVAKKFKIFNHTKNIKNEADEWHTSFIWEDVNEGKKLLSEALNQTLENVKLGIYNDITELANIIDMENKRELDLLNNELNSLQKVFELESQNWLQFLTEQSILAKELGIEKSVVDTEIMLIPLFNENNTFPYYYHGYKVIEKEIELMKARSPNQKNVIFKDTFEKFLRVSSKIDSIKNDLSSTQLREILKILKEDNSKNWVNYSFNLAFVNSQNKPKLTLILGAFYGLISGVLLVLLSLIIRYNKGLAIRK